MEDFAISVHKAPFMALCAVIIMLCASGSANAQSCLTDNSCPDSFSKPTDNASGIRRVPAQAPIGGHQVYQGPPLGFKVYKGESWQSGRYNQPISTPELDKQTGWNSDKFKIPFTDPDLNRGSLWDSNVFKGPSGDSDVTKTDKSGAQTGSPQPDGQSQPTAKGDGNASVQPNSDGQGSNLPPVAASPPDPKAEVSGLFDNLNQTPKGSPAADEIESQLSSLESSAKAVYQDDMNNVDALQAQQDTQRAAAARAQAAVDQARAEEAQRIANAQAAQAQAEAYQRQQAQAAAEAAQEQAARAELEARAQQRAAQEEADDDNSGSAAGAFAQGLLGGLAGVRSGGGVTIPHYNAQPTYQPQVRPQPQSLPSNPCHYQHIGNATC